MRNIILLILLIGVASAVDISNCQTLTAATFYRLTADISTPLIVCFNGTGNNITLNLDGHVIIGRNNNSFWNDTSTETNITIMNGTVANFSNAFRDVGASTLWRIENITFANISNTSGGAIFSALSTSNFTNLTIINSTQWVFQSTSSNVNFTASTFRNCNGACLEVLSGSDNFRAERLNITNATGIVLDFSDTATDGVLVNSVNITNTTSSGIRFNNLGSDGGIANNVMVVNSAAGFRNDFSSNMNVTNSSVFNSTNYVNNGIMNMTNVTFGLNTSVNINWNGSFTKTDTAAITEGTGIIAGGITFVSGNASLFPYLNTTANISLQTDVNCINSSVYVQQFFPTTAAQIIGSGVRHAVGNPCNAGLMSFNVSSFSGYASGPPFFPHSTLVSPLNSNVSDVTKTFSWICNHSDQSSLTATLFVNDSQVVQVTCNNDSLCSYPYVAVIACQNISWLVNCANSDFATGNNSSVSSFNQVPTISYKNPTPANNTTVYNINMVTIAGNATCVANASVVEIGDTNHTTSCTAQDCSYTNNTRVSGSYTYRVWYQTYLGVWFSSDDRVLISMSAIPGTSNISFNTTFNYTGYVAHTTAFYNDYGPLILGILSYGFAFILSRRYPVTLIAGGIGLTFVFFMTVNPVFLAAGLISILLGFMYKHVVG